MDIPTSDWIAAAVLVGIILGGIGLWLYNVRRQTLSDNHSRINRNWGDKRRREYRLNRFYRRVRQGGS